MDSLTADLAALAAADLRRELHEATPLPGGRVRLDGRDLLNLAGNDYLGLATELAWPDGADLPTGATASRLVVGNHPEYRALEAEVAAWKGTAAALVFGCGYLANVGAIAALARRGDAVYSDRLNHASIVDGCRLSGAKHHRYRHGDMAHLERLLDQGGSYRRRLLVTDALFSMDGDFAPLARLVALKHRYDAMLMVDEAHSAGCCGPAGAGYAHQLGLHPQVDFQMGTFSKAFGVYGAYVAASEEGVGYLINHARPAIFSTGLPPVLLRLLRRALVAVRGADDRRQALAANAERWREGLRGAGLDTGASASWIVPLIAGEPAAALALAARLREAGLAAVAIRPPTVPVGSARVRFSLSAVHDPAALDAALATVVDTVRNCLHG